MHDQRGQTATEYLGMIVVVAAIVAALLNTGVGSAIAGGISTKVCEIAGKADCAATDGGGTADGRGEDVSPPDGPSEGPPIGPGPTDFPVLPFPGSVSVKCTGSAKQGTPECEKGKGKVDGGVRAKGTVSRSDDKLNAAGCPVTTLSVTAALEAYGKGKVDGKVAGAGLEVYGGASTTYGVTVTPDRADAIAAGDADLPNPLDPTTLQQGEGIEMSEKYYAGINASGEYRALKASMGFEEGRKLSTGARRIDDSTMRVYVGDSDYVKQALSVGPGGDLGKLYFGNETELSTGKMRAIDIDVSTPEGWAAYQGFAATGTIPSGGAGTTNATSSDTLDITSQSKLGGEIGNLDASVSLGSSEGHLTETTNPDGSTTRYVDSRYKDVGLQVVKTTDADGNPTGTPTYGLNLQGVDDDVLDIYQQVNGLPAQESPDGNVRLSFSADDLTEIQDQAIDQIRQKFAQNRSEVPSRDDIREQMKGNPYAAVSNDDGLTFAPDPLPARLAAATSPEDVLVGLYNTGSGDANSALDGLTHFALATDMARNDGQPSREFPLPDGAGLPGSQIQPDCA